MDDKGARGNKRGVQVTKWRYWNPGPPHMNMEATQQMIF